MLGRNARHAGRLAFCQRAADIASASGRGAFRPVFTKQDTGFQFPTIVDDRPLNKDKSPSADAFGNLSALCPKLPEDERSSGNLPSSAFVTQEELDDGDGEEEMVEKIVSGDDVSSSIAHNHIHELLSEPGPDLEAALHYYDVEMKRDMVKPIPPIIRVLIHACGKSGNYVKAFDLFADYKSRHYRHNFGILADLFNACANAAESERGAALARANQLRQELLNVQNVPPVVYNNMIKAVGVCGDLEAAFDIVDQVFDRHKCLDQGTVRHLMMACISDKQAGFRHALLLWRKIRAMNLRKIKAGSAAGRTSKRVSLVEKGDLASENLLTVETYNFMLRATRDCGAGASQLVQQVLIEAMPLETVRRLKGIDKRKKLLPTKKPVTEEIMTSTDPKEILQTVEASDVSNVQSSVPIHQNLPNLLDPKPCFDGYDVMGLGSLERCQDRIYLLGHVKGFLKTMTQVDRQKPDVKTFSLLLSCVENNVRSEDELQKEMKKYKVAPDTDFYNQLMSRAVKRREWNRIRALVGELSSNGLVPNLVTFTHLASSCQNTYETVQLLTDMEKFGAHPNTFLLNTLLTKGANTNRPEMLHYVLKRYETYELTPDEHTINKCERFIKRYRKLVVSIERKDLKALSEFSKSEVKYVEKYYNSEKWMNFLAFYEDFKATNYAVKLGANLKIPR